jgi:hypothetical protein
MSTIGSESQFFLMLLHEKFGHKSETESILRVMIFVGEAIKDLNVLSGCSFSSLHETITVDVVRLPMM